MTKAQRRELKRQNTFGYGLGPVRARGDHATFLNSAALQRRWGFRIFARQIIGFARDVRPDLPRLP